MQMHNDEYVRSAFSVPIISRPENRKFLSPVHLGIFSSLPASHAFLFDINLCALIHFMVRETRTFDVIL